jgi:ring-1,2-phenylacetyl-CoA epoxidase subunit PaaA
MGKEYGAEELKLFADIKAGRTFDETEELPPFYRKQLLNLLWMQADSEYAGGVGYMPWIAKAPSHHERLLVSQIVKDEMRHAHVVYQLLERLGEPVESHTSKQDYAYRVPEDEINIGFKRMKEDFRVNIFYYRITYWTDFILFNFLMDRAAGHQLYDTFQSSYLPWKRVISSIYKEEAVHLAHGDKWVKILSQSSDKKDKEFLQQRLNLWWPRVMNVFGSTKGRSNDVYVRLGLKQRTNSDIRDSFLKEIQELCEACHLVVPEYKEELYYA